MGNGRARKHKRTKKLSIPSGAIIFMWQSIREAEYMIVLVKIYIPVRVMRYTSSKVLAETRRNVCTSFE